MQARRRIALTATEEDVMGTTADTLTPYRDDLIHTPEPALAEPDVLVDLDWQTAFE